MCFNYVEIFALLLNVFNGWMKLPSRKYCLEDFLETFSPMKILAMNIAPEENLQ